MSQIYENDYRREHSTYLNYVFDIKAFGVDYYNPHNVGFEFKECFSKKHLWFKCPKKQIDESDYFVFCVGRERYFIVDKRDIDENFDCNNKTKRANIRINTIELLSLYECENALILKNYIDEVRK